MGKKQIIITLVFVVLLSACSSGDNRCVFPEDVIREYKYVDKADGVTKKEAGLIAQYEFIQRGVKNYFLKILNEIKSSDENTWIVTFQSYGDGPESGQALDVCVDKRTGEITCWRKRPLVMKEGKVQNFGIFATQRIEAE